MSDKKNMEKVETGFVVCTFIKEHGTKKKGDKETYHVSTANQLVKAKVAEITEKLTEYVPKKAAV